MRKPRRISKAEQARRAFVAANYPVQDSLAALCQVLQEKPESASDGLTLHKKIGAQRKWCKRSAFLPYSLPMIGKDEIQEVIDTLESGWLSKDRK